MIGTNRFIQKLVKDEHVYLITAHQLLEWVRNPTPISKIIEFKPWLCDKKRTGISCDVKEKKCVTTKKPKKSQREVDNNQDKMGQTVVLFEIFLLGLLLLVIVYKDWHDAPLNS